MFRKGSDFEAFERVMVLAHLRQPIRILSYCVLSNHWHFLVWPEEDGQLTDFSGRLAHIHAIRWRVSHRTVGYGQLYQGRFKSFPVQSDDQLLGVTPRNGQNRTLRVGLAFADRHLTNLRSGVDVSGAHVTGHAASIRSGSAAASGTPIWDDYAAKGCSTTDETLAERRPACHQVGPG
jgi:hypothetical protein